MSPVECPVPVDQLTCEVTLLVQCRLVDVQEMAVPREEGRRVVYVVPDVTVDAGEIFV